MSPWSDVEWTSLDTVTETKLDTMQGNLDYLRELGDRKVLASGSAKGVGEEYPIGAQISGTSAVRLTIPSLGVALSAVTLNNPSSGPVACSVSDFAIPSSVAKGGVRWDAIQIEWRVNGAAPWATVGVIGTFVWSRGTDIEYLDAWCQVEAHAQNRLFGVPDPSYMTVRCEGLLIVGKRTS